MITYTELSLDGLFQVVVRMSQGINSFFPTIDGLCALPWIVFPLTVGESPVKARPNPIELPLLNPHYNSFIGYRRAWGIGRS